MSDLISRFNEGKLTSTDITEQINDQFWSKGAIKEAMRKRVFTQLGDKLTQPKHYGDIIVKERHFPVFHPMNQIDNGINANAAQLVKSVWYAYSDAGVMVGSAQGYRSEAIADAVAASLGTAGPSMSGAGNLFNGDSEFAVLDGAYPTLPEEGGNVNAVNARSIVLKGQVAEFGLHMKFTQRSIDMDSRVGVLAQKSKDLGEAKGDVFEAQVQSDLLNASETNRTFAGGDGTNVATSLKTLTDKNYLAFADLRLMEQALKQALVPKDTKLISGSKNIDTVVVGKAYYVYVGQQLYPTLQDMQHNGVNVWEPIESYYDGARGNVADGEIGRVGAFRFIEVDNMQHYAGAGADATAGVMYSSNKDLMGDAAGAVSVTDVTDGPVYTPDSGREEDQKPGTAAAAGYDVFPILFVGTDSFATVGFAGDSARIKTAMPKPDANNDPFGKKGSMSIAWYFGTLIYRAERIRQIVCTAKIV